MSRISKLAQSLVFGGGWAFGSRSLAIRLVVLLHFFCLLYACAVSLPGARAQDVEGQPAGEGEGELRPAQEEPRGGGEAFPLFGSEGFVKGDFDAFLLEAAQFIGSHPDTPQAELLFSLVKRRAHRATNYQKVFEVLLEKILEGELTNGLNEEAYRKTLAGFYRKRGLEEKARRVRTFEGYVLDCLMLGPFGNSYRACLDVAYEPERDLLEKGVGGKAIGKEYVGTDRFRKLVWRKYPYELPVRSPAVNMFNYLRPSRGCAYALIQVRMDEAGAVLIDIRAGRYFKLWVNRAPVLDVNGDRKREASSHLVAVNLGEGWNQILLKLPNGSFTLALRDTRGRLIRDLELERGLTIHPVKQNFATLYEGDYNGGALRYYSKLAEEKKDDPLVLAAYSYMLGTHGLDVDAFEAGEAALAAARAAAGEEQGNLFLEYYMSTCYENAPHYPHEMARNKAKELWDGIVKEKGDFVLAYEKIAGYLTRDDKHEEALKEFKKISDMGLDNFYTHRLLLNIYTSMRWERETMAQIKEIEKRRPDYEWLYDWWEGYYSSRNNVAKAWEFTEKSYQLNKSGDWFLRKQASRALRRGKLADALKIYQDILEKRPDAHWAIYRIADIYRKQGKYADAIEQRKKLLEMYPESASDYETIGNIYREWAGAGSAGKWGKTYSAIHWYEKSLILNPGDWTLRRYVQYLKGEDEDFWRPYACSQDEVMRLIKESGGKEAYPKAKNLIVLDETITKILPDGSQVEYVHKVYKILDISGKDRHSTPYVSGELLELRTILPDGTILEPASVYGSFTMPALNENVCIEQCYRTDSGYSRTPGEYESDRWYFQDSGYDEPVMKRRQVVIIREKPRDKKTVDLLAKFRRSPWSISDFINLKQNKIKEKGVKFTKKKVGDTIVYSWTSEKMPRIEPERYMPPRKEVLPNAQFTCVRKWSDFTERLKERTYVTGVIPTKLIRKKANEITAKSADQYEQLKALYEWCMREIKGGYGGGEANAILLEKKGNRETLFMAFLNALEIPFDTVLIGPNPLTELDTEWGKPDPGHFGGSLIRVKPVGQKCVYVTLDTRYSPLGKIPEYYQGAPVYVPGAGMEKIFYLPRELFDGRARREIFSINLDSLTAGATLEFPSTRSYGRKESYKDMPYPAREQYMEEFANHYFPGALLKSFNLPDLEKVGRMFEMNFTCLAPNFLTKKEGGEVLAKTAIDPLELQRSYADKATREFPMVLGSINLERTHVTINLADQYEVVKLPISLNERNDFGTYVLTFSRDGPLITIKRSYTILPQRIELERHEDFIEFCKKIDEAELGRIVLKEKAKPLREPKDESEVK